MNLIDSRNANNQSSSNGFEEYQADSYLALLSRIQDLFDGIKEPFCRFFGLFVVDRSDVYSENKKIDIVVRKLNKDLFRQNGATQQGLEKILSGQNEEILPSGPLSPFDALERTLTAWCNQKAGHRESIVRAHAMKRILECAKDEALSLDLSGFHLTSLPDLGILQNLQELNLENNDLTSLPESIGALRNLRRLNLENNALTSLPYSIGDLSNLQELDLFFNLISSLPLSMGNLQNLLELNLSFNQLASWPDWLAQMKNLRTLNVQANKCVSLPLSIEGLELSESGIYRRDYLQQSLMRWRDQKINEREYNARKLAMERILQCAKDSSTHLDLSGLNLTSLPDDLSFLQNLQHLNLENNALVSLPKSIGTLQHLQTLNLFFNQITSLPVSMGQLQNLRELNLSFNLLTVLPACIAKMRELRKLNLAGNNFHSLPEWLGKFLHLQELNLDGNRFDSTPNLESLQNLETLSVSHTRFVSCPEWVKQRLHKQNQAKTL